MKSDSTKIKLQHSFGFNAGNKKNGKNEIPISCRQQIQIQIAYRLCAIFCLSLKINRYVVIQHSTNLTLLLKRVLCISSNWNSTTLMFKYISFKMDRYMHSHLILEKCLSENSENPESEE